MVNEVESILHEIRERVRAEEELHSTTAAARRSSTTDNDEFSAAASDAELQFHEPESLTRVSAHLTTTARAWDKLPPLFSNRKGGGARLELWIKARLKVMSRWFTWEQVNFNSAVHHALADTLQTLSAYAQELSRMRADLAKESAKLESTDRETKALRAAVEAHLTETRKQQANLETRTRAMDALASELNKSRAETNARLSELALRLSELATAMNAQMSELANQLSGDDQRLREEQRVCFKQLSLEVSEAAALEDRGRRALESRLNKLEKAASKGKD